MLSTPCYQQIKHIAREHVNTPTLGTATLRHINHLKVLCWASNTSTSTAKQHQ
jgi:hypothetical protein